MEAKTQSVITEKESDRRKEIKEERIVSIPQKFYVYIYTFMYVFIYVCMSV